MASRILLAEDDPQICEIFADYFSEKSEGGIEFVCVPDGAAALELLHAEHFDLVLLDVMMPEIDGFSLCRKLRASSGGATDADVPLLFLTARAREDDVLYGYALGCDDYIIKPFSTAALYAKCIALLKRASGAVLDNTELVCGGISINLRTLAVTADGSDVSLAPKEFALLRFLIEHKNWVVSRDMLLDRIWGADYFGSDRVVDNHIKKLRKALGSAGRQIRTVISRGYQLTD